MTGNCDTKVTSLSWALTAWLAAAMSAACWAEDPKETAAPAVQQPVGLTAAELADRIDALISQPLEAGKIPTSPPADDAEFLRRAFLDITGVIPPLDRVEPFLDDASPDKRARLIDELLASPEYARHMTDQWRELLIPTTAAAARREHEYGLQWLDAAFRENMPYDVFVCQVLTADGMQRDNGATTFLLTHQSLDEIADRVSRVFLGVQITCAQCHDHPFTDWKQNDYWGMAAFFSKVKHQYEKIDRIEHYGVSEQGSRKPLMTPPSLKQVAPTFLRGEAVELSADQPLLPSLVGWMTAPENPYFAKAFVNRLWRTYLGRGLVEPIDDLREDNPGTHPELFKLLAAEFTSHGYDIHHLIRAIANSQTYQRTSRTTAGNENDSQLFSHMNVKVLPPYALHDTVKRVMQLGDKPAEPLRIDPSLPLHEQMRMRRSAHGSRDQFAGFFKGEESPRPADLQAGVPQALRMMNSQEMNRGSRVITALSQQQREPEAIITQLYLAALARRPSTDETEIALTHVQTAQDPSRGLADVLWALLNGTEFITNH